MNITIQSVNCKADATLSYFITEKVRKLFKYSDRIIRAEVRLVADNGGNPRTKSCDIRLMVPGNDHFVSRSSDVFEKSVLESVRTMQQLLRRSKPAKMLHHARRKVNQVFSK